MCHPSIIPILIALLGSSSWHTREKAFYALQHLPAAVPHLKAAQGCDQPEIAIRATALLDGHYKANADRLTSAARPANYPRIPWIDMLPADYPGRDSLVSDYLGRAQGKVGRSNSPEWGDYRFATRLFIHQMFVNGTGPEGVQALLDQMAENERQWIQANGSRYNPPLTVQAD